MALPDDETEKKDAEPVVKKGRLPIVAVIGLVALISAGGGVGGTLLLKKQSGTAQASSDSASHPVDLVAEGADEEEELLEGEHPLGGILPLDTFVVNLNGGGFLRMQAQLEFIEREPPKKIYARMVLVRDGILALISTKSKAQILAGQGKQELRQEIKVLVNTVLRKEQVERVLFTQFLIQ